MLRHRRGSVYFIVLATALAVSVLAVGSLGLVRTQAKAMDLAADASEARLYALSGIELGRWYIAQNTDWRTQCPNGTWTTNRAVGQGAFTLEVTDPFDGNLANQPHDPIRMVAIGSKGSARHIIEVTLVAEAVPLDALKYAVHTGGQLHIRSGQLLKATGATVSTNGSLRNDGTIDANVEVGGATAVGSITGTFKTGVAPKACPASSVPEQYASLGVEIQPGNTLDKQILSPQYTPWGKTHPEGVYVIRSSSDIVIKNTRVNGTLVIICPGKKVTIDSQVFFQPARPEYPALVVNGHLVLQYTSATPMSEANLAMNYNPPVAPYNGQGDYDLSDEYPSEINGLIHATGTITVSQNLTVRGAMIGESYAITDAVDWGAAASIVYTPTLVTTPPPYYTQSVKMVPQPGSWKQRVQ